MSYEKVKSICLKQNENGWYAVINSACNNVRPLYYCKWEYCKDKGLSKEELQKNILLDFYYGNFHNGTATKYGKFLQFLGGYWGCKNNESRACNTYHFYEKLRDRIREDYLKTTKNSCWEFGTKEYENYRKLDNKIKNREIRELKNALYKEYLQFNHICKPTIVRAWYNGYPTDNYILQRKKQIKSMYFTYFDYATKYTNIIKLQNVKRILENNNYTAEFIQI